MNLIEKQTNAFIKKLDEMQNERRELQIQRAEERKQQREHQARERDRQLLRGDSFAKARVVS
ncbi:hypothetical protein P3T76_016299 [Phytophthora citrophthora]|uniref:Uncharacterized protein n=1 Tax=Phytophthora citrophthora TaxID=4793 RepID=A0AAD9FXU1_9STRA|nr:hypothetical protein P3T76_016299 [Phytophthora citrophthora]